MATQENEQSQGFATAFMTHVERVPARAGYVTSGILAIGACLSMLAGRVRLSAFLGAWAAAFTAYGIHNQRHSSVREQSAAPDSAPRSKSWEQPLDYVDEMSAASFPASDPPAGPASLGAPTWPAGMEPH